MVQYAISCETHCRLEILPKSRDGVLEAHFTKSALALCVHFFDFLNFLFYLITGHGNLLVIMLRGFFLALGLLNGF